MVMVIDMVMIMIDMVIIMVMDKVMMVTDMVMMMTMTMMMMIMMYPQDRGSVIIATDIVLSDLQDEMKKVMTMIDGDDDD